MGTRGSLFVPMRRCLIVVRGLLPSYQRTTNVLDS